MFDVHANVQREVLQRRNGLVQNRRRRGVLHPARRNQGPDQPGGERSVDLARLALFPVLQHPSYHQDYQTARKCEHEHAVRWCVCGFRA